MRLNSFYKLSSSFNPGRNWLEKIYSKGPVKMTMETSTDDPEEFWLS